MEPQAHTHSAHSIYSDSQQPLFTVCCCYDTFLRLMCLLLQVSGLSVSSGGDTIATCSFDRSAPFCCYCCCSCC